MRTFWRWDDLTNLNPKLIFTLLPLALSSPPSSWTNINYHQDTPTHFRWDSTFYILHCVCDNNYLKEGLPLPLLQVQLPQRGEWSGGRPPQSGSGDKLRIFWGQIRSHFSHWSPPGEVARDGPVQAGPSPGRRLRRRGRSEIWVARPDTLTRLQPGNIQGNVCCVSIALDSMCISLLSGDHFAFDLNVLAQRSCQIHSLSDFYD